MRAESEEAEAAREAEAAWRNAEAEAEVARLAEEVQVGLTDALFLLHTSEHGDGERRGLVSIQACLKTRLTEPSPMFPDPVWPSALAVGMRRKVAKKR